MAHLGTTLEHAAVARIKQPKAAHAGACDELEQLPNIGPALAADLRLIGIRTPRDLRGRDPFVLYQQLCAATGSARTRACSTPSWPPPISCAAPGRAVVGLHGPAQGAVRAGVARCRAANRPAEAGLFHGLRPRRARPHCRPWLPRPTPFDTPTLPACWPPAEARRRRRPPRPHGGASRARSAGCRCPVPTPRCRPRARRSRPAWPICRHPATTRYASCSAMRARWPNCGTCAPSCTANWRCTTRRPRRHAGSPGFAAGSRRSGGKLAAALPCA